MIRGFARRPAAAVLLALLVAPATGCSAFTDSLTPARSADEVGAVTLRTETPLYAEGGNDMHIVGIDGQEPYPYDYEAIIFPGKHTVQVDVRYTVPSNSSGKGLTTRAIQPIDFIAEPTHEYRLHAHQTAGEELRVWIVDETSGAVAAGVAP